MLGVVEQSDLHVPERYRQMVDLFVNQNLSLPFKVHQLDIMTDGYAFISQLLVDIARARHHIHIDMYIFEDDTLGRLLADALIDKAQRGVEVRIVYDDAGSRYGSLIHKSVPKHEILLHIIEQRLQSEVTVAAVVVL